MLPQLALPVTPLFLPFDLDKINYNVWEIELQPKNEFLSQNRQTFSSSSNSTGQWSEPWIVLWILASFNKEESRSETQK